MSPTGHLAIGFAAKRFDTKVPLVWYLVGAYTIDLIYLGLSLLKLESFGDNPWSHSLLMAVVWSTLGAGVVWVFSKHKRSALLMGWVVFSHWVLDFIVWDNLPLAFSKSPVLGLGLYPRIGFDINALTLDSASVLATGLELSLLIVGLVLYLSTKKKTRTGSLESTSVQL